MAAQGQVQFFLGANAPTGFYSLYDQLLDPDQARAIYIIKGGPGCGKSTLMRQVARAMEEHGLTVEYILCSGDPDSLDGVVIPALGTALVDGTAPHVVEPRYPGLVEEYVDLGACYHREGLLPLRGQLMSCMSGYKGCYNRAYRCLLAAQQIEEDMRALLITPALEAKMVKRARGILSREVKKGGGEPGKGVQRFLGAVTHRGIITCFETADALCQRVYELSDSYGLAHVMLTHLAAGAMAAGYDVIPCPSPMSPDRMEHLLIPGLSLAFLTTTPAQPYPGRPYRRLQLVRRSRARLRFSRKVASALIGEAVDSLAQAKAMHDRLEALYNPHVDFDLVHRRAQDIIQAILERAEDGGALTPPAAGAIL